MALGHRIGRATAPRSFLHSYVCTWNALFVGCLAFILSLILAYPLSTSAPSRRGRNPLCHHSVPSPPTGLDIESYSSSYIFSRIANNQRPDIQDSPLTLIRNASLISGNGVFHRERKDVLFFKGIILDVLSTADTLSWTRDNVVRDYAHFLDGNTPFLVTVQASGRFLTPGLVDMHSHLGTDSWPEFSASSDTNEISESAVRSQLRSLDGINPDDVAIPIINRGGVTTSLVLPGSANLMGGEAYALKTRVPSTRRVEHMLLNHAIPIAHSWRWMKMACGENPKRVYGNKGIMPESRLGAGWLLRERFFAARDLMQQQDDWCDSSSGSTQQGRYPESLELESIVALLRGQVKLNVHCYETYDLEMMVRHSREYNFNITAFHHALEAWRVADMLKEYNIGAALFADHWGYKVEAYGTSVMSPSILTDKSVKVAFKSDHPVLNSQHLIFEAAKAHHYGLNASLAMEAVTSVPARLMGQDWRIGHIRPGFDADLVIWDRFPLEIGAKPVHVFTDGLSSFEEKNGENIPFSHHKARENFDTCPSAVSSIRLYNLSNIYASQGYHVQGDGVMIVSNGYVVCLGTGEQCPTGKGMFDVNGQGGSLIPGLIAGSSRLGLEEIPSEEVTSNGHTKVDSADFNYGASVDGLSIDYNRSRITRAAHLGGVLSAVAIPRSEGMVIGISAAIWTGSPDIRDAIVKETVAYHVGISSSYKTKDTPSVSDQIRKLKNFAAGDIFKDIRDGRLPLVVSVHEASNIYKIIQLKKQYLGKNATVTILGGSEVAKELGEENISVILDPPRCTPASWEQQRCLIPSSSPSTVEILMRRNVTVGLAMAEDNFQRGLLWETGWARADAPRALNVSQAIGLVTWNIARAYGLEDRGIGSIRVGDRVNAILYSDTPGELSSYPWLILDANRTICNPKQA